MYETKHTDKRTNIRKENKIAHQKDGRKMVEEMTEVWLSKFKQSPNDKRYTTCQRQINKRQPDQQTNMMTRNQIQRGVPRNNRQASKNQIQRGIAQ